MSLNRSSHNSISTELPEFQLMPIRSTTLNINLNPVILPKAITALGNGSYMKVSRPARDPVPRKKRSCKNCLLSDCFGGTGKGKGGLLCKAPCYLNCGANGCHGGVILSCLSNPDIIME